MEFTVGIGEMAVGKGFDDTIKTFSLASCLGVVMYAPQIHTMAMAHMLLPSSLNHPAEAAVKPARYVDTGIDALVHLFQNRLGIERKALKVSVFGGAEAGLCSHYNVSERNIEAARAILKKYGMKTERMEVGGHFARTLTGYSKDGYIQVTAVQMGKHHSISKKG